MRAPEVLDHRADLIERLDDPYVRRAWINQITMDSTEGARYRQPNGKEIASATEKEHRASAAANVQNMWHSLQEAEAYYVSPDLTQLVTYAASQLNDTDRVDRTILPTRAGIARFDGGLPFLDLRGKHLRISWIAWGPVMANFRAFGSREKHDVGEPEEVTVLWMWNDHRDEPDDIHAEMVEKYGKDWPIADRAFGRWGFVGSEVMIDNSRLGPAWVDPGDLKREDVIASGDVPQEFTNSVRLAHAFFLLLGQTVTNSRTEIPDRARRKRAIRAGLPARVTIVHLRNLATRREPGESLVEWSHRWVVRGHWHWYHCGPDHPLAQEVEPGKFMARLWLAPHVKGPADKPLIVTDKVYSLDR